VDIKNREQRIILLALTFTNNDRFINKIQPYRNKNTDITQIHIHVRLLFMHDYI